MQTALGNWLWAPAAVTRVGIIIVDRKKVLKQAGVVHDIKSLQGIKILYPYTVYTIPKWNAQ